MTPDDWTREIRERLEKATPGPWQVSGGSHLKYYIRDPKEDLIALLDSTHSFQQDTQACRDSAFIACAPTDIARLLEERKVLRDALEEIYVYAIVHFSQGIARGALAYVPQGVEEKG